MHPPPSKQPWKPHGLGNQPTHPTLWPWSAVPPRPRVSRFINETHHGGRILERDLKDAGEVKKKLNLKKWMNIYQRPQLLKDFFCWELVDLIIDDIDIND